ncbi:MAG: histidinol-phosphate transaminase [Rhodobacterales bacterium]|nr:histidinol-phosphate transaminase [Rhodobacterales bacterium]
MSPLTPRPGIMDIQPYVGGESKIPGVDRIIKLASNEGALGPSPAAQRALEDEASHMHRYPDGSAHALRHALGAHWGLDPERIVCGAGSDELLGLLCRAYAGPGDEVLYTQHGFLMYPIAARTAGATPVQAPETNLTADVDALLAKVTDRTRIVFLANPNNPTGTYLPAAEMKRLRDGLPAGVLLVIDAAYAEFMTRNDYSPGVELVDAGENVVMTRTFSKIYALGALRLGWAYCPASVADVLNRVRNPFNVAAPSLAAGLAALKDVAFTDQSRDHNTEWRAWTTDECRALGLEVPESHGNFILVRFPASGPHTAEAADGFLKGRGIIVRRMAGYGLPESLRVSIGAADEMQAFVGALTDFMTETRAAP